MPRGLSYENMNAIERNAAFAREIEKYRLAAVPSSFHTHSTFCDGRDDPEAIVQTAIQLGCPAIGFSGHAPVAACERGEDETLEEGIRHAEEHMAEYRRCIRALKEKYAGQIRIFLGVEQDYFSETSMDAYEYVIGSVHMVSFGGELISVDGNPERFEQNVQRYFGGDYYAVAEEYYKLVAQVYEKTQCSIIGHFDLITKFNEGGRLFDTSNPRYRAAAERALDALIQTPAIFEWNYGAIPRGYRTEPYLEGWMLEKLRAAGKVLLKTSDCHRMDKLLFGLQ